MNHVPLLAAWLHDWDPYIVRLGFFDLRWYGMAYIAGAVVGYAMLRWFARTGRTSLDAEQSFDVAITLLAGAFVGGRIGYCLFYSPRLLGLVDGFPYWGVLALHQGGMASHGGFLGVLVAGWWFAKRNGVSLLNLFDVVSVGVVPGLLFGRLANFVNGELYGRAVREDFPLAVKFPQEILSWPASKLENLAAAVGAVGVEPVQWLGALATPGRRGAIGATLEKLVEAVQNGNGQASEALRPLLTPRHPSQLYEAVAEGVLPLAIPLLLWLRPRRPGVVGSTMLVVYAVGRIVCEFFRLPDEHIGFDWLDLTRGQWLSVVALLVGVALLVWAARRDVPTIPPPPA